MVEVQVANHDVTVMVDVATISRGANKCDVCLDGAAIKNVLHLVDESGPPGLSCGC